MSAPATRLTAYCFANGRIEFTEAGRCPRGSIWIARGEQQKVRDMVAVYARHGYEKGVFLVPGVPEALDQEKAADALAAWLKWISTGKASDGLVVNAEKVGQAA